jgi:multiple sugar transport system substrate-binding protein
MASGERRSVMRKRWQPLVLLAGLIVLGACTSDGSTSESAGSSTGAEGPVTLNLWIFQGEDVFVPNLVKAFEAEHPNITINVTDIPEDNYVTKIDTALAAGKPPDIGYMYENRWMKAGRILPLDDIIQADGIDVSNYNPSAFSFCQLDGTTYCLGSYSGAIMLFYNKDLFDKAGLPYPSDTQPMTVDEYAALAKQLTTPNDDLNKYVWGGYSDVTTWWLDWRDIFSSDGKTVTGYLNDAPTVHMYDVLTSMIKDGTSPSESNFQFFGRTDPLATGQMAMTIVDNITAIPELDKAGINWGAAPVPVEKAGDQPWVSSWSDYWGAFSADPSHAEAAKEFVSFVGTDGNKLREQAGGMPLNTAMADKLNWAGDSPGRQDALQVLKLARPGIFLPANIFSIDPPLWDAWGAIVEGDKTTQQALDDAAPQMQQNLDRAWTTWNEI